MIRRQGAIWCTFVFDYNLLHIYGRADNDLFMFLVQSLPESSTLQFELLRVHPNIKLEKLNLQFVNVMLHPLMHQAKVLIVG
jgi:hypothetical protein